MAKKKLTELFNEAVAKAGTPEGRREEQERKEAEAFATVQKAAKARQAPPEDAENVQTVKEPPEVRPVKRPDPILPRIRMEEGASREEARLAFGGLVDGRDDLPKLGQLPLFRVPDGPRVPLLDLADARGGPIMARGRGAPLDLRLFVAACVMLPVERRTDDVVSIPVTVRELRDFCFPNGWQRGRDWPRVCDALERLHNHRIPGPFHWPRVGRVLNWVPVAVRGGATPDAQLDDVVVLQVHLPPGSASGPVIDSRAMFRLGVESSPRFRAYIAAYQLAWRPGVSRRRRRDRRFHMWSSDPENYLVLTREDRRRLAFGLHDSRKHRTLAEQDAAWEDLPGVEILTREASTPDGRQGWLVVPEAAADAIRKR